MYEAFLPIPEYNETTDMIFNPVALRKAKIVYNFSLSECNGVKYTSLWCIVYYFMAIFISNLISTLNSHISVRVFGPWADMGFQG